MEHLLGDSILPILVSYLLPDDFSYDLGDFPGYPSRNGWDFQPWLELDAFDGIDIQKWTNSIGKSPDELPGFLQASLFFGVLSDGLQSRVHTDDFVRYDTNAQCKILTTTKLDNYLEQFQRRFSSEETTDHLSFARYDRILAVAKKVLSVLRITLLRKEPSHIDSLRNFHFHCSLLLPCLGVYWMRLFRDQWAPEAIPVIVGEVPLLIERMQKNSWCPYTRTQVSSIGIEIQAICLATGTVRTKQDHTECSSKYCVANQAGDDFVPKHFTLGCDCEMVEAPIDRIVETLQQGFIPIIDIVFAEDSLGEPTFHVEKADAHTPYIAISHIWADGLGNSLGNSVPRCQLKQLVSALQKVPFDGTIPFWMDTWCIPAAKKWKSLRNFSIGRIHSMYKESYGVLVLDLDLTRLSSRGSYVETISVLLSCGWMTRLWTFQEGALPPSLYLRLSDGVVEIHELVRSFIRGEIDSTLPKTSVHFVASILFESQMPKLTSYEPNDNDMRIQDTISSIGGRTTSRKGDEAFCIATTIGIDPAAILAIEGDTPTLQIDRMCKLFESMPSVPANAVFTLGARLDRKGFRWAPRTFLHSPLYRGAPLKLSYTLDNGRQYLRPMSYLHPRRKGIVTHLSGVSIPEFDLSQTRWMVKLSDGVIFHLDQFLSDKYNESILTNLALLLPRPPSLIYTVQLALLVGNFRKTRDPKASRFRLKRLTSANIIGRLSINRLNTTHTAIDRDALTGEYIEPKWWVLDGG